jgi:signal recognition particle receptor subunit beta
MVQINFAHKEIQCKIVYYGPGMSGKTTNLELVHEKTPSESRGDLTSIATTGERTLYFDYMPLDLGSIAGIRTKFQLYTVPGQIYYKSTRRLVLQGVDGIVFVADSSAAKLDENRESMKDLEENLREMGRAITDVPIVIQWNKRDLPDAMALDDLQRMVNTHQFPSYEAVATTGQGVFATLKALAGMVLEAVNRGGIGAATRAPKTPAAGNGAAAPTSVPVPAPAAAAPPAPASPPTRTLPPIPVPSVTSLPTSRPSPSYRIEEPARVGAAASAPATAVAAVAAPAAVAERPRPAPSPATVAVPAPAAPPAPAGRPAGSASEPSVHARPVADRMVKVSGLGRAGGGGNRWVVVLALLGLIGAAAWFVLTKVM